MATAKHIGLSVGTMVTLNDGTTRQITSVVNAPNWVDVSVITVDADLPNWASVTPHALLSPADAMFVSAGLTGTDEVRDADDQLRGWYWGGSSGSLKWTHTLATYANQNLDEYETPFEAKAGSFAMTAGDSGGGMYVQDSNGRWHLQGIGVGIYPHNGPIDIDGRNASEFMPAQWPTNQVYQTNEMLLPRTWLRTLVPLAGDTDYNGTVDFADLLHLANSFGQRGTWSNGDFTGDGLVNFSDLLAFARNYHGTGIDIASLLSQRASASLPPTMLAPEPAAILGIALPVILSRRRRALRKIAA